MSCKEVPVINGRLRGAQKPGILLGQWPDTILWEDSMSAETGLWRYVAVH